MSHPEQSSFVQLIVNQNSNLITKARVLEIGSYDVYGSTRSLFSGAGGYIGLDLCSGPGVDLVANAHDLAELNLGRFEIIVSCETLEHDPNWRLTVRNMVETLSDGGVLIITCASTLRPEHGTFRTSVHESPGTTSVGWDYYRNVSVSELKNFLQSLEIRTEFRIWENRKIFDLYCLVERSADGAERINFPDDKEVNEIIRSTPVFFVALRMPIRIVSKLFGVGVGEKFGLVYWNFITKRFSGKVRSDKN